MNYNRALTIYTANSRKTKVLQRAPMDVQELFSRLGQSQAIPYTLNAYKALKKAQQDELKDVGAYIAGELRDGRRKAGAVLSRCAAVLDADNLPAGGTDDFIRRVEALNVCCCIHSTAKHSAASPRLRVVVPFLEDISAEQYSPVTRRLCQLIQPEMTWFDPTTAEAGRIMYNPAHCQDVAPVYQIIEGTGFLDASALLEQLGDWKDPSTWPKFPRETAPAQLAAKQEDPETKGGVVGAFCRCYDVPAAIEKFLPGVYTPAGEGRYTFAGGSTYAGAVLYEGGRFLFSHHATDPAGGRLVNSFDLVRIHLFGDLDDDAKDGTPTVKRPSYQAMIELARKDEKVSDELARAMFANSTAAPADDAALLELGRHAGEFLSVDVLQAALKALGVTVRLNQITNKVNITGMPATYSTENAVNTLPILLMDLLNTAKIKGVTKARISDYLYSIADAARYNPVLDMLHEVNWDGVPRFKKLLEIIHIDENSFQALLFRKWLIQCVAMAHNTPQFIEAADGVLTIQGAQGAGKTTLLRKLAIKTEWFSEGVSLDMRNKDDIIRAVSVWITELGELESTLKKNQESLKSFLTQRVDKIRAPYAAESTERVRRTSFGATVNPDTFLRDPTGDRRFWIITVKKIDLEELLALDEDWFMQLWAEVYIWWRIDPKGFHLTPTEHAHLDELNQEYRETLPGEEEIREAFDFDLPADQWGAFSAAELKTRLFIMSPVTVQQIAHAMKKLAREDKRLIILRDNHQKLNKYRIPIRKAVLPQKN